MRWACDGSRTADAAEGSGAAAIDVIDSALCPGALRSPRLVNLRPYTLGF